MSELLTGYRQFDTITGGLQQADVLTVATSPPGDGVGLALSIALNVASARRHRVGLFALSLNRHRISQCLLAMRAGILQHQVRTGQMNAEERQRVTAAARELSTAGLWIDGSGDPKAVELLQRSRQLVETRCISLIVIDDISLLQSGPLSAPRDKLPQGTGWVEYYLRTLARELGVALIACAPLAYHVTSSGCKASQRENPRNSDRTRSLVHALFLSREESPQKRRTDIFPVFMTQERSGLVTELSLCNRPGDRFP